MRLRTAEDPGVPAQVFTRCSHGGGRDDRPPPHPDCPGRAAGRGDRGRHQRPARAGALALRYGQPGLAAYLLLVSKGGLVAVSSLVVVRAARLGVTALWLAHTWLVLAVIATLACNVGYRAEYGWPSALLSGRPAVVFTGPPRWRSR